MCAWPRVDQSLSRFGYASRRQGAQWVRGGRVTLAGGEAVSDVGERIDPALLRVDGQAIEHPAGLLVMLHKPVGYVCTHGSGEGPTVYDLLPERWMNRIPPPSSVGRLDKDTSGLLLITDDGELIHRWTSPRGGSL
jgi:16S rRNA pseudouridine516 synthase